MSDASSPQLLTILDLFNTPEDRMRNPSYSDSIYHRFSFVDAEAVGTAAKTSASHFSDTPYSLMRAWREEDPLAHQTVAKAMARGASTYANSLLVGFARDHKLDNDDAAIQIADMVAANAETLDDRQVWWTDIARDLSRESHPIVLWNTLSRAGDSWQLDETSLAIDFSFPEPRDCGHGEPAECEHSLRKAFFWDDDGLEPGAPEWNDHVIEIVRFLRKKGVLAHSDIPGRDFAIVPKSWCKDKVTDLVQELALKNPSDVITGRGETTYVPSAEPLALGFRDFPERGEHIEHGIPLIVDGEPTPAAIRAAAFSAPLCREATHINWCTPQQLSSDDERFVIARGAGYVTRGRDHTYVADPQALDPTIIGHQFGKSLSRGCKEYVETLARQGSFAAQSPAQYQRQYADQVLQTDVETLDYMARYMPRSGIRVAAGERAADVSTNGVFWILAAMPQIDSDARIYLRDYAPVSHEFTRDALRHRGARSQGVPLGAGYQERVLRQAGGKIYRGRLARLVEQAQAVPGAMEEMEPEAYTLLVSGFTWGSYEITRGHMHESMGAAKDSLVPGGHALLLITQGNKDNTWESGGQVYQSPRVDETVLREAAGDNDLEVVDIRTIATPFRPDAGGTIFAHLRKPVVTAERDDRITRGF